MPNRRKSARCAHQLRKNGVRRSLVTCVLAFAALAAATGAPGALNMKWYSFDDLNCTHRVDPVTVIFFYNGYQTWVNRHIPHHGVWTSDVTYEGIEKTQKFWDAGYCTQQWGAFASGPFWETRYHIRFREGHYFDATFGNFSIGTPHHETNVSCGHAVDRTIDGWSGYDKGRRQLANTMAINGPHYSYYKYVGNSALMTQCNGWTAGSNGQARYIRIDSLYGPTRSQS